MQPGQRIREYQLEQRIGEGGMGEVWRATQIALGTQVAIKVMSERLLDEPGFKARFLQEAKAQAALQHPQLVHVREFWSEGDIYCLVMPLVEGQSLQAAMVAAKGPLPVESALAIAQDVLGALDYAHRHGVIHRDVKPSNILLDTAGRAHLTDFGIALVVGESRKTSTGLSVGTPHYMSPEQIRRPKSVDHRSDVYSFGCVLYEMLAGRPPFESAHDGEDSDFTIKQAHVERTPASLRALNPEVPEALENVAMRALAKTPDERFSGCGEFARALADAMPREDPAHVIYCGACGTETRVPRPESLSQAKCTACGTHIVAPAALPPQARPRSGGGWKVATVLLATTALVAGGKWIAVDDAWRRERAGRMSQELNLAQEKALTLQQAQEIDRLRDQMSRVFPVRVTAIRLRNETDHGVALGEFTALFFRVVTQYVAYSVTIAPSLENAPVKGTLKVRYIKPDGKLKSNEESPVGFTLEQTVSLFGPGHASRGWGNANGSTFEVGVHRIEFWWNTGSGAEQKIGETAFVVQ